LSQTFITWETLQNITIQHATSYAAVEGQTEREREEKHYISKLTKNDS
jgi:hypothetical protein